MTYFIAILSVGEMKLQTKCTLGMLKFGQGSLHRWQEVQVANRSTGD